MYGDPSVGLSQGISQAGNAFTQLITARKQASAQEEDRKAIEELWANILKEPSAPAEGQPITPDPFAGARQIFKGMNPKTLAKVMGSSAFSPQGLKALSSMGGAGGGSPLLTGEQLQQLQPNLASADLKGYVFQRNENGDWLARVQPKKPVVASPGQVILDANTMEPLVKIPERLQVASVSPGGQLRLIDTSSGANAIIAERAPAPGSGGGGDNTPNIVLQVPDVGPDGQPITKFLEYQRGKGGAPGALVQQIGTGTKAAPKPLPEKDQADFIQAAQGARALNDMEKSVGKTGRLRGYQSKAEAFLGTDPQAVQFETSRNQLKLAAQSLIKGIPSNFDVETVIDTLPALTQPESVNRSRIAFTRQSFKDMVQAKIGFYKGLNYQLPADVYRLAQELNVDPDAIQPLSQQEMITRTQAINKNIAAGAQKLGVAPAAPGTPQAAAPVTGGGGAPSIGDLLQKYGKKP